MADKLTKIQSETIASASASGWKPIAVCGDDQGIYAQAVRDLASRGLAAEIETVDQTVECFGVVSTTQITRYAVTPEGRNAWVSERVAGESVGRISTLRPSTREDIANAVAKGAITIEQANGLLDALEGKA